MSEPDARVGPVPAPDAADRFNWVWHAFFAGTLAVPTAIVLATGDIDARERLVVVALAAGFALWHWVMLARHPQWWGRPSWPVIVYWLGAVAFMAALTGQSDTFTILLYGSFPLMFATLDWWGMVPVVAVTALTGWQVGVWEGGPAGWLTLLASAGLAAMIALFVGAIGKQSEQRRAALAALAATRAELAATARRAGVLEERERLARELHDTVAQGFTSIVTQLEAAEQALSDRPTDAGRHVDLARQTARNGLGEVRRSMRALRPDLVGTVPLAEALARTCQRWSAVTGILAELRSTGTATPLHPDAETALLRTAQEALTNVAKHAAATRATVTLSYLDGEVTLDVDDDGTGFADLPAPQGDGGFGLTGMRERLAAVGGSLEVESTSGRGTTIVASVPS